MLYLQNSCHCNDTSQEALHATWLEAQNQLGLAFPNAGRPSILDIPPEHNDYLQSVMQNPRFALTVGQLAASFKLVEIDPVLAFQYHVSIPRSDHHCGTIRSDSPLQDILPICLPTSVDDAQFAFTLDSNAPQTNGCWIRTGLNTVVFNGGLIGADAASKTLFAGIAYGINSPLIQVVCVGGRYFLRNGYHRAFGLRRAGISHLPCLLLEAPDYAQAGFLGLQLATNTNLFESENPPTCGHFTQGRAFEILVKKSVKVIRLTWSETIVSED